MGKRGVEPLRLAALVPKTSVSAIPPLARIVRIRVPAAPIIYHRLPGLSRDAAEKHRIIGRPVHPTRRACVAPIVR